MTIDEYIELQKQKIKDYEKIIQDEDDLPDLYYMYYDHEKVKKCQDNIEICKNVIKWLEIAKLAIKWIEITEKEVKNGT